MAWNVSDSSGTKPRTLSNQRKHGVSFEEACQVFRDPLCVSVQDRSEGGEPRWQTLGLVEGLLRLTVAHTVREEPEDGTSGDVIRIISARRTTRKERRRFEDEKG